MIVRNVAKRETERATLASQTPGDGIAVLAMHRDDAQLSGMGFVPRLGRHATSGAYRSHEALQVAGAVRKVICGHSATLEGSGELQPPERTTRRCRRGPTIGLSGGATETAGSAALAAAGASP